MAQSRIECRKPIDGVKVSYDDSPQPNWRGCPSGKPYALVASFRGYSAHRVAQTCSDPGRGQAWTNLLGHACSGIDRSNCASAGVGDSSMGWFLPVALLPVMGNRLLFLSKQLFHCGLWGCGSSVDLATLGPSGKRHRCVDVRNIRKCSVCSRHSAARPRHPVLGWKRADRQSVICPYGKIDE